jgi:cellulose synthase/poly-beta-1,6-N-acetylglucosamine synthase-like glycosyltransferase
MRHFLDWANHSLFYYYLASNFAYLIMLIIALRTSAKHLRHMESARFDWMNDSPLVPPITLVVPAHNEEQFI